MGNHYLSKINVRFFKDDGTPDVETAERVYDEIVSIPLYPLMKEEDVRDVIEAVKNAVFITQNLKSFCVEILSQRDKIRFYDTVLTGHFRHGGRHRTLAFAPGAAGFTFSSSAADCSHCQDHTKRGRSKTSEFFFQSDHISFLLF